MKNPYIVIVVSACNDNLENAIVQELCSRVNEMIEQGYMPIGGVSAIASPTSAHGSYGIELFQAMMLKGE